MTRSNTHPSLEQLAFQRKWLVIRLKHGKFAAPDETACLNTIEEVDLMIAATPCRTRQDLCLKMNLLTELLHPSLSPIPEDCLEHILLLSILADLDTLTNNVAHQIAGG